ncbi:transposition, RNA-mediated [Rhizoctonia solani]|uniref:Transposition, RNA-mediated n=1 Tax=Rhizoctonia solani TaxID=456999 RepID=A0A8H7M3N2_9AGAM|nr:transposition, RNA-mediated [Rhizoctonia solani]
MDGTCGNQHEVVNGTTYRVILPPELMRRGIRPTFHASLLKPYIPDEDRRFPRHDYSRFISLEGDEDEWAVEKITNHRGRGNRAMFEVLWYGGEITWEPIKAIRHLVVFRQYLEILGIKHAHQLPLKDGVDVEEPASDESDTESENLEVSSVQVFNDKSLQGWEDTPSLLNAYIFTKYLHLYICLTTIPQAITIAPAATPDAAVEGEAVEDSLVRMMISYVARSTSSWKRKICEHAPNYSKLAGTTLHTEAIVDNKGAMIDVLTVSTKTKTYLLPLVLLNAGGPQARYLGRDIPATASPGAIPAMHLDPNAPEFIPSHVPDRPRPAVQGLRAEISEDLRVMQELSFHADELSNRMDEAKAAVDSILRTSRLFEDLYHETKTRLANSEDQMNQAMQELTVRSNRSSTDCTPNSLANDRSERLRNESRSTLENRDFDSHRGSTIDAQLRSVDEPSVNGSDRGSVPPIQSPEPVARDLPHDEQLESIGELLTSMGHGGVTHQGKEEAENQPVELVEQDGDTDAEGEDEETGLPGTTEGADDHPSRAIDLKGKAKAA